MAPTTLTVERRGTRHVVRLGSGLLRPQVVASDGRRCRVGLLATTALLLGGDVVELHVRVGPDARLDLFDVAGTVAYHGRGRPAGWHVHVDVGPGAHLSYAGEPFVVADGADVDRSLEVDLARGATAALRDTVVLGRTRESGGPLRSRTTIRRERRLVLLEEQRLDPDGVRNLAGMLGPHRVLDTLTWLGDPTRPCPGLLAPNAALTTYALAADGGVVARWLGGGVADSPLVGVDLSAA